MVAGVPDNEPQHGCLCLTGNRCSLRSSGLASDRHEPSSIVLQLVNYRGRSAVQQSVAVVDSKQD